MYFHFFRHNFNFHFLSYHFSFLLILLKGLQPLLTCFKWRRKFFNYFVIDNLDPFLLLKLPLHHQHTDKTLHFNLFQYDKDVNQILFLILILCVFQFCLNFEYLLPFDAIMMIFFLSFLKWCWKASCSIF